MEEENKWDMNDMKDEEEEKKESNEQKDVKENKISMEIANQWFASVNPQKVLHISMMLFEQVNGLIEKASISRSKQNTFFSMGMLRREYDLMDLMQCVSDCAILVASQTLSLGHWNYAKPETYTNNGEMVDW